MSFSLPPSSAIVLCDSNGAEVSELEVDHTIRYEQSRSGSVTFQLGYDQNGASELLELLGDQIPEVRCYRQTQLVFRGYWAPQQETAGGTEQDGITCEFRSPFSRLEERVVWNQAWDAMNYSGVDQGDIAWDLIHDANVVGETGLVKGPIHHAVTRNRKYDVGQGIAEAITDLSDLSNGIRFTETFLPPGSQGMAAFNIWNPEPGPFFGDGTFFGRDVSENMLFEFGEATLSNVLSVERTIGPPINRVIATGGTASWSNELPMVAERNSLSSQSMFGIHEVAADLQNIKEHQEHLIEAADGMLKPYPVQQIAFEPDLVNAPVPIDDYWLGDVITFRAKQDNFKARMQAQVNAIEIERDGTGFELAHRVEFGDQIIRPLQVVRHAWRISFADPRRKGRRPHPPHHRHHHHKRLGPGGPSRLSGVMPGGSSRLSGVMPGRGSRYSGVTPGGPSRFKR